MATQSFEQLIAGANKIKQNQLPESNTAGIVGEQLIQMVNKQKDEETERMKGITEYNVSVQHPTSGISGTNKYTLEGAIAKIPAAYRRVGIKCSFLSEDGSVNTYAWKGGIFDSLETWETLANVSASSSSAAVGMNPYFPFAKSAKFYYNKADNSGLTRSEAESIFFGIYIDKGSATDKMYVGRLENRLDNKLVIHLAKDGKDVLQCVVPRTIQKVVIVELTEMNASGYHGFMAINPSKRSSNTFITMPQGGTFERFALSENIFNYTAIFKVHFITGRLDNIEESSALTNEVMYSLPSSQYENLYDKVFARMQLYKYIEDRQLKKGEINVYASEVPATFPSYLWHKKMFVFPKGAGSEVQTVVHREARFRELQMISFSSWVYYETSVGNAQDVKIKFALGKQYPVGRNYNEGNFEITLRNTNDYSRATFDNPLKYTINNSVIGNIDYYVDKEIIMPGGEKYIHVRVDKKIDVRYGNLFVYLWGGYIPAGRKQSVTFAIIDPILEAGQYRCEYDSESSNYGYSLAMGDFGFVGKQGDITSDAVKTPPRIMIEKSVINDTVLEVVDKKTGVDIYLKATNMAQSSHTDLFRINSGYYYPSFEKEGKMYVQFGVKITDVAQIKSLENKSNRIFEPSELLQEGNKLTNNNDYENCKGEVVHISDDGIATVRLECYAGEKNRAFEWGFNVKSTNPISTLHLHNFCVSNKPINPCAHNFVSKQRITHEGLAGKSLTIFGDSELNSCLQALNVVERLGVKCFNAAYGGHKMGWADDETSVDPKTKSWLYTWDIRNKVLKNKTDFYIFLVSTNDEDAGIKKAEESRGRYDYQSINDVDVKYVLDNYPSLNDSESEVQRKLQIFAGLSAEDKRKKFNMSSVYCAYIEQILSMNPRAKIIFCNSPVTCSGLLTGKAGPDLKGIWKEGQNPKTARKARKPIFDRLDEHVRKIADKYNLPVVDLYHNVGLTFENYTDYCIDSTHWVDINNTSVLGNTNPIPNREGDLLVRAIRDLEH